MRCRRKKDIQIAMNAFRMASRIFRPYTPTPLANALGLRRGFAAAAETAAAAPKGKKFVPKNFKEAWLSDVGVSIVLMVFGFFISYPISNTQYVRSHSKNSSSTLYSILCSR